MNKGFTAKKNKKGFFVTLQKPANNVKIAIFCQKL